jgi:16S rRNA A1518/A1519 N6-dimethyltransferase RsmA/KsgA/DIM1 with predicted DNA glycosylase/AP lyase activity
VRLKFKNLKISQTEKKTFIALVKAMFNNRRKTIKNSLSNSIFASIDFTGCEVDLSKRAEQLELDQFEKLAEFVIRKNTDNLNLL